MASFQGLFSFRERMSLTIFAASILCPGGDMLISQEEFEAWIEQFHCWWCRSIPSNIAPKNDGFPIGISFSRGLFSGSMWISGRVYLFDFKQKMSLSTIFGIHRTIGHRPYCKWVRLAFVPNRCAIGINSEWSYQQVLFTTFGQENASMSINLHEFNLRVFSFRQIHFGRKFTNSHIAFLWADFCLLTHPIIPSLFVFPTGFGSSKHGMVWASRGRQSPVFVEDLSNIRWHLMEKDDTRLPLDVETSLSYMS